jgi:valyl-tRNA synthetase
MPPAPLWPARRSSSISRGSSIWRSSDAGSVASKKLANQDFLEKAKPVVIEAEREKLVGLESSIQKLHAALAALED